MPSPRKSARRASGKRAAKKPADSYHHGDLRRALVDGALALIEKEGPKGLTLRAVARRAGVSQAAPYRHFADKEALLAAVAEEGFRMLAAEIESAMAAAGNALDRFQASGVAYVRFAANHPSHFRVMFGPHFSDKKCFEGLTQAGRVTEEMLTGAIEAAQNAGYLPKRNPRELALSAWAIVHGLASLFVDGQLASQGVTSKNLPETAARLTGLFFGGVLQQKK